MFPSDIFILFTWWRDGPQQKVRHYGNQCVSISVSFKCVLMICHCEETNSLKRDQTPTACEIDHSRRPGSSGGGANEPCSTSSHRHEEDRTSVDTVTKLCPSDGFHSFNTYIKVWQQNNNNYGLTQNASIKFTELVFVMRCVSAELSATEEETREWDGRRRSSHSLGLLSVSSEITLVTRDWLRVSTF